MSKCRNISQKSSVVLLSVILFFLTGCTLSMDEWIETEETKGYDNLETVQNDFYSLEYEYKSTTRSLTEDIQKYIVQVESDSIIYFMDNTPSDWLPKAGGQVVANCCELFPMGLMGHVLSVEKQNGLIKVVTAGAELEDCFEDFNLDFDTDLLFNNQQQDSVLEAAARGQMTRSGGMNEQGQLVFRDWTMFNAMKQGHRPVTRGLEDEYKEDVDKGSSDTKEMVMFEITQDDPIGKAITNIEIKGVKPFNTVDFKAYSVTKTNMHKIIELKKKREYTSSTTYDGYKLQGMIGRDFNKNDKSEAAQKKRAEYVDKLLRDSETLKKFSQKIPMNTKGIGGVSVEDMEFTVEIPLGTLPFGIIIRLKPVLECQFGLFGEFDTQYWTEGTTTTTEVIDGKKIVDESRALKKKELPKTHMNFSAFGSFSLSGGAELFIGVGKRLGKKAAGVGVFAALTANLGINITPITIGDYTIANSNDAFNVDGKLTFGGKLLTAGWFGDISFLTHEITLDNYTKHYNPLLEMNTTRPLIPLRDENDVPMEQCNVSYKFTDLGMHGYAVWYSTHKPILAIYKKDPNVSGSYDKPDRVVVAEGFNFSSKLEKDKEYEFSFSNYDTGKPVYIIPGVQNYQGTLTLYKQYQTVKQNTKPIIQYSILPDDDYVNKENNYHNIFLYQISGEYQNHTMTSIIGSPQQHWWGYKFMLPFTLHNASSISKHWSDWGVYVSVNVFGNHEKYISLKKTVKQSGSYAIEFGFSYISNQYNPQRHTGKAYVYYVRKGESKKRVIGQSKVPEDYEYSYHLYKTSEKDPGDVLLKVPLVFENFFTPDEETTEFYKSYKHLYNDIGNY